MHTHTLMYARGLGELSVTCMCMIMYGHVWAWTCDGTNHGQDDMNGHGHVIHTHHGHGHVMDMCGHGDMT